jgi:hypothetical protein
MKKSIYILFAIGSLLFALNSLAVAQNLIGFTRQQVIEYFPGQQINGRDLDNGNSMLILNPTDKDHTTFYYIDKYSQLCYMYSVAGPSEDYTGLKKKFMSREGFIYLGKTPNGWPYWSENYQHKTYYWSLAIQMIGDDPYTIMLCTLDHP